MAEWVCDYCGTTGHTRPGETTDQVQCPTCGEPVVPTGS
jgi:rubrerythrin